MFLLWKLTLQKTNLKNLILITFGILFIIIIIISIDPFCKFETILISGDVSSYEQSLDPEFCEIIVDRINLFNEDCESQIEILDCG